MERNLRLRCPMEWQWLENEDDLKDVHELSRERPVMIYKHSTRCMLSSMVRSRLERGWKAGEEFPVYQLDLIRYRKISDAVAKKYHVEHASPQVLVIHNGECIFTSSHMGIDPDVIIPHLTQG